jgi:hypothetical protein
MGMPSFCDPTGPSVCDRVVSASPSLAVPGTGVVTANATQGWVPAGTRPPADPPLRADRPVTSTACPGHPGDRGTGRAADVGFLVDSARAAARIGFGRTPVLTATRPTARTERRHRRRARLLALVSAVITARGSASLLLIAGLSIAYVALTFLVVRPLLAMLVRRLRAHHPERGRQPRRPGHADVHDDGDHGSPPRSPGRYCSGAETGAAGRAAAPGARRVDEPARLRSCRLCAGVPDPARPIASSPWI